MSLILRGFSDKAGAIAPIKGQEPPPLFQLHGSG